MSRLTDFQKTLDKTRDYPSDAELTAWPNCTVPDCENKACLKLDSERCWPHTVGFVGDTSTLTDAQRRELEARWKAIPDAD